MSWSTRFVNGRWVRVYVPQRVFALPRFLFDQQRATCEACHHVKRIVSRANDKELLCGAAAARLSCSLQRMPGNACGPDAALFKARAA